ncbi:hypothetical protein [Archangium violaceum]|uniref:hypothetical protein n=1 Tax=Archangium violaceum TaxID=83451 RepID=UPI00136367D7|nr:hypothetical protein [Archangium violaceum]
MAEANAAFEQEGVAGLAHRVMPQMSMQRGSRWPARAAECVRKAARQGLHGRAVLA